MKTQAYQSRLSISGIAFFDDALYVTTNVGLLEVHGRQLGELSQWFENDNVVSGPWRDASRPRLWVHRVHDHVLLAHEQGGWQIVRLPPPPGSYYTRGDMLEGFRGVSDSSGFWLVGAGHVWKRSDNAGWVVESRPPMDVREATIAFAKLGNRELHVVSSGGCGYLTCVNRAFWRDSGQWGKPVPLPVARVEDVLATSNGVFIRGNKGELLRVENDSTAIVPAPGPCEAIARSTGGMLIASFRKAGVFALDTGWRKLFDDPLPATEGEQSAFLAERDGLIAYATTTVPQLKPGKAVEWYQSGALGLWVSDGTRLARVELLP